VNHAQLGEFMKMISRYALKISATGIFLGGLLGILTWWAPSDLSDTIERSRLVFWGLIILPTATLCVMVRNDLESGRSEPYLTLVKTLGLVLGSNLVGTALASVFFSGVALNTIGMLGGLELGDLYPAWKAEILWVDIIVVLTAAVVGASVIGLWAHQYASSEIKPKGEIPL
jgi:hypothetical protein